VEPLSNYQNDLSKLRFNSSRRSTTTIVLYDTHSSNYDCPSEKEAKPFQPRPTPHSRHLQNHKSLEDFFYHFSAAYHEHNFSKTKPERETLPPHYEILIFDFCGTLLLPEFEATESEDHQQLGELFAKLRETGEEKLQLIESLFELEGRA
jgi:hypothetical protein